MLGTIRPGRTIYVPFASFAGATGASITMTGLAVTDIEVYKNGSVTQRASDAGYTLLDTDGIDFDGLTGIHGFSIDLADNSDAGFWASGAQYTVVVSTVTIDGQTVSFVAAMFRIGYDAAVLNTTIATLASQTSFTLASGPAEDDAINGFWIYIHDVASAVQQGWAIVLDYTGATKTVTLVAGPSFTMAATDNISVMAPMPMQPATAGRTVVVDAAGLVDATAVKVGPTGSGTAQTAGDLAARLPAALVSGRMDASVGAIAAAAVTAAAIATGAITEAKFADNAIDNRVVANGTVTAAKFAAGAIDSAALNANAVSLIRRIASGTADSGSTTTVVDAERTEADTDYWKGAAILFTSGTISGQSRLITGFNAATDTITFTPAVTQAVGTNTYEIHRDVDGAGAGLTAIPWNAAWDAEVQSEAADALVAYDPPTGAELDTVSAKIGTPAGASVSVDVAAVKTDTATTLGRVIGTLAAGTHNPQGGDNFARLGAPAGASVSADIAAVKADTAAVLVDTGTTLDARIPAALVGGRMDSSVGAMAANVLTATAIANDAITAPKIAGDAITQGKIATGAFTAAKFAGDYLAAVNAEVDTALNTAIPGAPTADSINERVAAIDDKVLGTVAAGTHNPQTGDSYARLGAAGSGLSAVPWNAAWDAEVESEVDDALGGGTGTALTGIPAVALVTTVTNLTNAPTAGDLTATMKASVTTAATAATPAVASLGAQAKADVNAEVVDVLRTDTIPDSYSAAGAQPTMAQALLEVRQVLTERAIVGVTETVYKPDGTTPAMTLTYNATPDPTAVSRTT